VKVGDLVRMVCTERSGKPGRIGIVMAIADCAPWPDDVIVLSTEGVEEWESDEIEVINESG